MTTLIAIIDDDPSVCRALQRLVRSHGLSACGYLSGESFFEAMAAVHSRPFCMVVDVQMPGMDGFQVHQRMTREHPGIPLIFMTAQMDPNLALRSAAAGALGFLNKPFDDTSLMTLIKQALDPSE